MSVIGAGGPWSAPHHRSSNRGAARRPTSLGDCWPCCKDRSRPATACRGFSLHGQMQLQIRWVQNLCRRHTCLTEQSQSAVAPTRCLLVSLGATHLEMVTASILRMSYVARLLGANPAGEKTTTLLLVLSSSATKRHKAAVRALAT